MKTHKQNQQGVIVLFSLFLVGIVLAMSLTLTSIFIPKIRLSGETKKSSAALYAADSAIEWCIYVIRHGSVPAPIMSNGATYTVSPPACTSSPVRAEGVYQGITRVYQLDF